MPLREVMFIAGDPSGDVHAARVIGRLRELAPDTACFGIGGPAMRTAGFSPILPFDEFNVMGFWEVLRKLPFVFRARKTVIRTLAERRPAALVLVDYPGFNLRILRDAARLGIPAVWYITPKVWAWKKKRAEVIGRLARAVALIFPFEPRYFEGYGARVEFVGNPVAEALEGRAPDIGQPMPAQPRIAIVPGSRRQELRAMLGPMIDAIRILRRDRPVLHVTVSRCPWLPRALYAAADRLDGVDFFEGTLAELFTRCDAALVTSGTATLEAALCAVPHVVVYRTSPATYAIARAHTRGLRFIGLPNLVAGESVVPECIQDAAGPANLAARLAAFLDNSEYRHRTRARLLGLRGILGAKKPSVEVARMIMDAIGP